MDSSKQNSIVIDVKFTFPKTQAKIGVPTNFFLIVAVLGCGIFLGVRMRVR